MTGQPAKRPRRKWLKRGLWAASALVLLLVVCVAVATSEWFLRSVILPRVGTALHGDLTARTVSLDSFSRFQVGGLELRTGQGDPVLEIGEADIHFQWRKLLDGVIALDKVSLHQPRIHLRTHADGSSNLGDWIATFETPETDRSGAAPAGGSPLRLDIGQVTLSEGLLAWQMDQESGLTQQLELKLTSIKVDQIRNGVTTKASIDGLLTIETRDRSGQVIDAFSLNHQNQLAANLNLDLIPEDASVEMTATISGARGRYAEADGTTARVRLQGSGPRLERLSIELERDRKLISESTATGSFDLATGDGVLDVVVRDLPPIVLELATLESGLDFQLGGSWLTNHVEIVRFGEQLKLHGGVELRQLVINEPGKSMPPLNATLNFGLDLRALEDVAEIHQFDLRAEFPGPGRASIRADQPMTLHWKDGLRSDQGGQFLIRLDQIRLSDWAERVPLPVDGLLNLESRLHTRDAGGSLELETTLTLTNGVLRAEGHDLDGLVMTGSSRNQLHSFAHLETEAFELVLRRATNVLFQLSGTGDLVLNPFRATSAVKATMDTGLLSALSGRTDLPIDSGRWTCEGTVGYETNVLVMDGRMEGRAFNLRLGDTALRDLSLIAPFRARYAPDEVSWNLPSTSLQLARVPALELESSGRLDPATFAGSMDLETRWSTPGLINEVLKSRQVSQRFQSYEGNLRLRGELAADRGQAWWARLASTNVLLVASNNAALSPNLAQLAEVDVQFNPADSSYQIRSWRGTAFADGTVCGQLDATGGGNLSAGRAALQLTLTNVNEHALAPLVPMLLGDQQLVRLRANAGLDVNYDAGQASLLSGFLDVSELILAEPRKNRRLEPGPIRASMKARMITNRVDLQEARIQLTPATRVPNRLDADGWLDVNDPGAISGSLKLHSAGLDLVGIREWIKHVETPVSSKEAEETAGMSVARTTVEKPAAGFPFRQLDLQMDILEVFLKDLYVTNWVGRARLGSNWIQAPLFSMTINGAPFNASLTATNGAAMFDYALNVELDALNLVPVVNDLYPTWKGLTAGDIYAGIYLRCRDTYGKGLLDSATGDIYLGVTNANVAVFDERFQRILRPVAIAVQTPELFSSPLDWAYVHHQITNNTLVVHNFTIICDAYIADMKARVPLAREFEKSVIPDVPLQFYLSRNLVTQLGVIKQDDARFQSAKYVKLPDFVTLTGTLEKPDVKLDKLKLSGAVLGKAGDFIGGSTGAVFNQAANITDTLGEVLSGRKFTRDNTPPGVLGNGVSTVFNALGGLLGGTGKTIETGTGMVTGTTMESGLLNRSYALFNWPRVFTNTPNPIVTSGSP